MKSLALSIAIGACVSVATPLTASAQAPGEWRPDTHRSGAGAEIYVWDEDFFGTNFPIIGFANIGFLEQFFIDVYLPFNSTFDSGFDGDVRAGIGNPTVAFRFAPTMGIVRWWVGGGLSLPLGAIDDDDWSFALLTGAVTTALYDSHLWAVDALPVFATWGVDIRVVEWMSLQFEGKIAPWIPITDRNDAEVVIQNRLGVELRHPRIGIGGGVHLKVVWVPTDGDDFEAAFLGDDAQLSLEPHFAYTNEVFFVRLGILQALDAPLGVFDDNEDFEVVSGHLTVGGSWD